MDTWSRLIARLRTDSLQKKVEIEIVPPILQKNVSIFILTGKVSKIIVLNKVYIVKYKELSLFSIERKKY
jgi:hypothetical protein